MAEKLSKVKDWLVFALSLEVNIILTLFLFNVDIWGSIWQVARVNIAVMFFYLWLWFIDLYLNNYSAAAIEERRRLAKEGVHVSNQPVFKKKVYEPKPEPVVEYQPQPKPAPVLQPKPQPVVQPAPVVEIKPEPVVEVKIEHVVEPVIEPQPEPVVQPQPEPVVQPQPEPVIEETPERNSTDSRSNREQLLAWIQEEENQGGN